MTNNLFRTFIYKSATAVIVLLFAAVSLHAQEQKKEADDKPVRRPPAARESQPGRPAERPQSSPAAERPRPAQRDPAPAAQPAQPVYRPQRENTQPADRPARQQQPQVDRPAQRPENAQPADRPARQQQPQVDRPAQRPENTQPVDRPARQQQPSPNVGQPARSPQQQSPMGRPAQNDGPSVYQPNRPGQPDRVGPGGGNRQGTRQQEGTPQQAPRVIQTRRGDTIRRDAAGRVSEVRTSSGAVVYHPPTGGRRVEMARPGGRVVVASAPGHGYVQRQVVINNTTIVKRTYVMGGVSYARIYRPVPFRGVVFNVYTPVHYYRPAFYVYAYNPWAMPVRYNWGWGRDPWYGYYGGYFSPYSVYASPSLWLTDYLIANTLQEAYEERMANAASDRNNYPSGEQSALTPEVKQMIADEVRRQLDQERADSQQSNASYSGNDAPSLFADNAPHVFVAYASLAVNSDSGDCYIGEGDVLQTEGQPPVNSTTANATVLASRGQDCRKGAQVSVQLQDLQEMQNHMRETVNKGLGDLQTRQGQGGIPALPAGASGTIDSPYAAQAQPDTNAGGELTAVTQEADRDEQAAVRQSQDAPITISLGQTIDEVTAIQGPPQKIVNLGAKKLYVYQDIKITFVDGRVTDVQ